MQFRGENKVRLNTRKDDLIFQALDWRPYHEVDKNERFDFDNDDDNDDNSDESEEPKKKTFSDSLRCL